MADDYSTDRVRHWRQGNPDKVRLLQDRNNAKQRALRRLGREYSEELEQFYRDECHEAGISPYATQARLGNPEE